MQMKQEKISGVLGFRQKQNPLTVSEDLRRSLICQTKEQNVPTIYKAFDKIYFFCVQSGQDFYLSGPVCAEELSYVEIHQFIRNITCQ